MSHSEQIGTGLLLLLGLCLLVACGGEPAAPAATEAPQPVATTAPQTQQDTDRCAGTASLGNCDAQTLEFPLPPDAACCSHMDPITTFLTDMAPDAVFQFYADYLEQNGWAPTEEAGVPGLVRFRSWTRDAKRLNVGISVDNRGTGVQLQLWNQ